MGVSVSEVVGVGVSVGVGVGVGLCLGAGLGVGAGSGVSCLRNWFGCLMPAQLLCEPRGVLVLSPRSHTNTHISHILSLPLFLSRARARVRSLSRACTLTLFQEQRENAADDDAEDRQSEEDDVAFPMARGVVIGGDGSVGMGRPAGNLRTYTRTRIHSHTRTHAHMCWC